MTKKILVTFFIFLLSGMIIHAEETPQQFEGFDLVGYSEGNKKAWDIKGDTADMIGSMIKLTNIVANAYGDEQMHLTAQRGNLDRVSGQMHLEDDVVITTEGGAKMTTDSLDWHRDKDLVKTKDDVVLTQEGMTATGTGVEGHPGLKTAQMEKDVTVTVNTEPKGAGRTITITCDGPLEIEYESQKAVFNNNVVAIDAGRKLMADKIELFFDNVSRQIKEMICTGNVSIIQGENTTYSEKAIYNAQQQKLTLVGQPKLILFTEGEGFGDMLGGEGTKDILPGQESDVSSGN
ncbi:MAG: LPS export ABC transporter periplasmic protein LptC [Candidatus Omnitrophota bacterium]